MKKILIAVFLTHLLLLVLLVYYIPTPQPTPVRPIRVQTLELAQAEPIQEIKAPEKAPPAPEIKPPADVKKSTPQKPKQEKPKPKPSPTKKKETPPPKPEPKKPDPKQAQKQAAKEKIRQLADKHATINAPASSLQPLQASAERVGSLSVQERHYIDKLIAFLQGSLVLPEKESITLSLNVKRTGAIRHIEWKNVKSETNRRYLTKELAQRTLPAFGNDFPGEDEHTFELTLSSE